MIFFLLIWHIARIKNSVYLLITFPKIFKFYLLQHLPTFAKKQLFFIFYFFSTGAGLHMLSHPIRTHKTNAEIKSLMIQDDYWRTFNPKFWSFWVWGSHDCTGCKAMKPALFINFIQVSAVPKFSIIAKGNH